jgi:hypothetical protein
MFTNEMIQSLMFIAVITAALIGYAVFLARREDRDAESVARTYKDRKSA